jgi:hypothetical protein
MIADEGCFAKNGEAFVLCKLFHIIHLGAIVQLSKEAMACHLTSLVQDRRLIAGRFALAGHKFYT